MITEAVLLKVVVAVVVVAAVVVVVIAMAMFTPVARVGVPSVVC